MSNFITVLLITTSFNFQNSFFAIKNFILARAIFVRTIFLEGEKKTVKG